jgi:hypothetical protein
MSSGKGDRCALISDRLQGTLFTVWLPSIFCLAVILFYVVQ